jgi:hypothetical protein
MVTIGLGLFPQANRNHGPSNYQPKYTRGEIRNGLPDNRRQLGDYQVARFLSLPGYISADSWRVHGYDWLGETDLI